MFWHKIIMPLIPIGLATEFRAIKATQKKGVSANLKGFIHGALLN
jgi:hypothetical protein